MESDQRYLHQRRQTFYVSVECPPSVRRILGRRFVRSLKTRDIYEAQRRRWDVLRDIKQEIGR